MANELTKVDTQNLSQQELEELDGQIAAFIERNKGNAYEINRITSEGAMILTSADKHSKEKAVQKFFERFRKNITGENNRTQNDINKKLAEAQYAAQQVIVKLAEQQQLSFEVISFVHNKINSELLAVNAEINQVYGHLADTNDRVDSLEQKVSQLDQKTNQNTEDIKKIYGHLLKTDEDIKKLAKDVDLMTWAFNIKKNIYNGVKYCDLDDTTKIVCVVRDFFDIMQGKQGTINDLNTLETAIEHLGLTKISREDFIRRVGTNDKLYNHLMGEDLRLNEFTTKYEEIIFAIQKARDTEIEDDRKFLPVVPSDINDFVLELLYNLKQLTLAKELYDRAEKLFLSGNILEALPLLKILEADNIRARYMLSVIFREGWSGVETNPDYVKSLLSENISGGDVCSMFFGVRIDLNPKETASNYFYTLTKLADDGDVFAQYELAHYVHKDSDNILKYMKLATDQNYFLAAYELGEMYYFGRNGAAEDDEQARKYFEIAAKSEQHTGAMYYLGEIYWNGFGGAVNKKKAVELYMKIYEYDLSSDNMIFRIAEFYDNEEKNPLEAIRWLRIGAKQGYPKCLVSLGLKYHYGVGIDKNWSEATKYFEQAITAGEDTGVSEQHLGNIYWEGDNDITADKKKAVEWYKKAYERGNSSDRMINNIAIFYGDEEINPSEKIRWWRIGAEKNYPLCLAHLGIQYLYGGYVEENWSESVKYFERSIAAGLNVGIPQKHLGDIYWEGGNGITADKKKAVEFYKKAYELGKSSDETIKRIADFYDDEEKNPSEAVKWWRIGAEKNYPMCLAVMGWAYHFGYGVEKNWLEAVRYYERAMTADSKYNHLEENLGDIYWEGGYGVSRNYDKAIKHYEKAYSGNIDTEYRAHWWKWDLYRMEPYELIRHACILLYGFGVHKEYEGALELFKRAISAGSNDGFTERKIAEMISKGLIPSTDFGTTNSGFNVGGLGVDLIIKHTNPFSMQQKMTNFWYAIAAAKGDEVAKKWLKEND